MSAAMIASLFGASVERRDDNGSGMSDELEILRLVIVQELRRVGVRLPEEAAGPLAEVVLAEAVRLSVRWVEGA